MNEAGEQIEYEKLEINNTGSFTDTRDYTWNFDLEADQVYNFKLTGNTPSGYCVNLYRMIIEKANESGNGEDENTDDADVMTVQLRGTETAAGEFSMLDTTDKMCMWTDGTFTMIPNNTSGVRFSTGYCYTT